ncbi:MAG TPA: hypothetical protein VI488_13625 [Candidatus Angelobacter sp.]
MAVVASAAAGAVIVLIVAGIIYDRKNNPHTIFRFGKGPEPVYQWIQSEDKAFSFLPGEGKAWGPVEPQGGEIRYAISAYLPVDTGLMDAQWAERMDGWSAMKTSSSCYESKIKSSSKACPMPNQKPYLIFIRDLRSKQFVLGETPVFANQKALQEQNSVTVTIFTRKCVEHCK